MKRPDFVTNEDLARWDANIEENEETKMFVEIPLLMEACRAGLWMAEQLADLGCPKHHITVLQFNAGRYAFGRDIWQAHIEFLEHYKDGKFNFEESEEASQTD